MKIKRMGAVFSLWSVYSAAAENMKYLTKKRAERIRRIQKGNGKGRNNTLRGVSGACNLYSCPDQRSQ